MDRGGVQGSRQGSRQGSFCEVPEREVESVLRRWKCDRMICRQTTQVYGGDSGLSRVYEVSPLGKTLVYLSWPCAMTSNALAGSRDYTARIM